MLTRTIPVRFPKEDDEEFKVGVSARVLTKCRESATKLAASAFPWAELLLAIAMLCFGAAISALIASVSLDSGKGRLLYIAPDVIGSSSLVAYFMLRKGWADDSHRIATELLEDLPDPQWTVSGEAR